jgi:hypothetical protein
VVYPALSFRLFAIVPGLFQQFVVLSNVFMPAHSQTGIYQRNGFHVAKMTSFINFAAAAAALAPAA